MKVKDVLFDLGPEVKVQIFGFYPEAGGYHKLFIQPCSVATLHDKRDQRWVYCHFDKVVDHTEYIKAGDNQECHIYLSQQEALTVPVSTENELDAFFKKLYPDAYVRLNIWYGDIDAHADEFIRVELCGADYAHIKKRYKSIVDLFNNLEIASINTDYKDKAIVLDCKRRTV